MKAIYAGSFDPIHSGHINIIRRAVNLFGSITLLLADNPSKHYKLSSQDRLKYVTNILKDVGMNGVTVEILPSNKFLADYCAENNVTHIVKGLRNGIDLENEMSQEWYNKKLNENIETVYFTTEEGKRFLSSTSIRYFAKMPRDKFIDYMKKTNLIEEMDEEKFIDYLWFIHNTYKED